VYNKVLYVNGLRLSSHSIKRRCDDVMSYREWVRPPARTVMLFILGGGYNYNSTAIRLQFDRATTIRRSTSRRAATTDFSSFQRFRKSLSNDYLTQLRKVNFNWWLPLCSCGLNKQNELLWLAGQRPVLRHSNLIFDKQSNSRRTPAESKSNRSCKHRIKTNAWHCAISTDRVIAAFDNVIQIYFSGDYRQVITVCDLGHLTEHYTLSGDRNRFTNILTDTPGNVTVVRQSSDEHEAVLIVGGTATVGVRRRHHPLAAAAGHRHGRPARLAAQNSVPGAPTAVTRATTHVAAAHHQRLTLDAHPRSRHQHLGPLAEPCPAARSTALRQPKLGTVADVRCRGDDVGAYNNQTQTQQ